MARMTSKELSDKVSSMTAEEALKAVAPLLRKYSLWNVPGYDFDDLHQELSVITWKCWSTYDRSKGSFINVLIRSFENKLINLRKKSYTQVQPIVKYSCSECGSVEHNRGGKRRPRCYSIDCAMYGKMKEIGRDSYALTSLDAMQEDSAFEAPDASIVDLYTLGSNADPDGWRLPEAKWRVGLKERQIMLVEKALVSTKQMDARSVTALKKIYPLVQDKF